MPEWKENSEIREFLEKHEINKLEDIYLKHISDELAQNDLSFDESNENYLIFVNALKLRGYSLKKAHNPL